MDLLIKAMARNEPILVVSLDDTNTVEEARKIHDTYPTASAALGRTMLFDIVETRTVLYHCPCSKERVLDAIVSLGKEEIQEFIKKEEPLEVQCQFCKKRYSVSIDELKDILTRGE